MMLKPHIDGNLLVLKMFSLVGLLVLALLLDGCGGGDKFERIVIDGAVTFKGQSVKKGRIRFIPARGSGNPATGATIADGRYCVDASGGAPVGKYKIAIVAYSSTFDENGEEIITQYIPDKYNARSELEIEIPPGSGPITKNYELTK